MINRIIRKIIKSQNYEIKSPIELYLRNGRVPWSFGYSEYKEKYIKEVLQNDQIIECFKTGSLPDNYGLGIDDRSVEYPWIFSKIDNKKQRFLDAGSTFNYEYIIEQEILKDKEITIFTYFPEHNCFFHRRVSYLYGDLRDMMFKDSCFDLIVCHSTIEHIDMDNSMYGYTMENCVTDKSYEYLKAVDEMLRVLVPDGKLLLTFPYGIFENHGFFQQFDEEMLGKLTDNLAGKGKFNLTFFKYEPSGWRFATQVEINEVVSYNPHTGIGKGSDGAAHSRGIACIEFIKNTKS